MQMVFEKMVRKCSAVMVFIFGDMKSAYISFWWDCKPMFTSSIEYDYGEAKRESQVLRKPRWLSCIKILLWVLMWGLAWTWSTTGKVFSEHAPEVKTYHFFQQGMAALQNGNWARYQEHFSKEQDPDLRMALEIACHTTAGCPATFDDIVTRIRNFPLSPYLPRQIRRAEALALSSDIPSGVLFSWLSRFEPRTTQGWLAYAETLEKLAEQRDRNTYHDSLYFTVKNIWHNQAFTAAQEEKFLEKYSQFLKRKDHERRLEKMLWSGATHSAMRQSKRVNSALHKRAQARLALQLRKSGVDTRIQEVPPGYHDEGLAYDRVVWRWRGNKKEQAIALALEKKKRIAAPEKWLPITLDMVSYLLFRSRLNEAEKLLLIFSPEAIAQMSDRAKYRLWSTLGKMILVWAPHAHSNENETKKANERAVQYLKNALLYTPSVESKTALLFWLGVAHERLGNAYESTKWYEQARDFGIYFYGQVAAKKLRKANNIAVVGHEFAAQENKKKVFLSKPLVRLAVKLHRAGMIKLSRVYLHHLIDHLSDPFELSLAVQLSYDLRQIDAGVYASRLIERSGMFLDKKGYPWLSIERKTTQPHLIMAVVRQESSFNTQAKSSAGARGLMQIMPNTAKYVSSKIGVHYNLGSLTNDPLYNIHLGNWYINNMLHTFDHQLVPALAGYNAGPGTVKRWLDKIGKPDENNIHSIVTFIEKIPYRETKSYIKKVLANHTIYRILRERKHNAEILFSLK